jgi:hypothetical protein
MHEAIHITLSEAVVRGADEHADQVVDNKGKAVTPLVVQVLNDADNFSKVVCRFGYKLGFGFRCRVQELPVIISGVYHAR